MSDPTIDTDSGDDTDSIVRSLAKGSGFLLVGIVVEMGVSFLAKLLIARYLGPSNFGEVSIGLTVFFITSTIAMLGLREGVARYLSRFDDEASRRGVLVSATQMILPASVAATVLLVVGAELLATEVFTAPSVTPIIRLFAIVLPFASVMQLAIGAGQGYQRSTEKVVLLNFVLPLVRFGSIAVVLWLGLGVFEVAVAYALPYVVAAGIGLYYLWARTPLFSWSKPAVPIHRELLSFSAPLIITSAMIQMLAYIDTLILASFAPTSDVGIYNVIYPIGQMLTVVLTACGFLMMPILSELHSESRWSEMKRLYRVISKWIFFVSFPLFILIGLFSPVIIRYTFGPEYLDGAVALSVLAVGFFIHAIAGLNANALVSIGDTRVLAVDNVGATLLNVVLNFALIPRYSYLGAAVATTLTYVARNVAYSTRLYRRTGMQPLSDSLVRPASLAVGLATVCYGAIRLTVGVSLDGLLAFTIVYAPLYALSVLYLGGVQNEEVMLVLSFEERFGIDLGPAKQIAKWFIR